MIYLGLFNNKKIDIKKIISYFFVFVFVFFSFSVIGFIIYKSIYFLKEYGLGYLISSKWKPSNNDFGIWNFIVSTFWTIFFSFILIIKANLFVSIFISKFLNKKIKKIILFFLRVLAGIPSVLFAVFVLYSIGPLLKKIPNGDDLSMLSAIIVLTLMTLPTTIVLTVNLFDGVSKKYEISGLALGIKKITVIFDIVKKVCSKTIKIILFFGFCRIIGEVSALTMVAGGGTYDIYKGGFSTFFFSSIRTLTTVIGFEFKENFGKLHESSLFSISLLLLIIVLISNIIFTFLNNQNRIDYLVKKINKINFVSKIKHRFIFKNKKITIFKYYKNIFSFYYRKINMYFFMLLVLIVFSWLLGNIFIKGIIGFLNYDFKNSNLMSGEDGILGILLSTLILIMATLIITIPIAFFTSVFVTEYSYNSKFLKKISKFIRFIIFQLSSIPTILFGMFGYTLFVTIFNFGFTIIAGAFTMILIIFPIMVETIIQSLENIPKNYRYSGYALGLSKKVIIWKIIIPMALKGILISIILGINKIISESSPLLIVMGNSTFDSPKRGIFSDTRTLSTHIALLNSESPLNLVETENVIYQTALVIFVFIIILNIIVNRLDGFKDNKINNIK